MDAALRGLGPNPVITVLCTDLGLLLCDGNKSAVTVHATRRPTATVQVYRLESP